MAGVDPHLLQPKDGQEEEGVEFVAGQMMPTFPFERRNGALIIKLYDQEGNLAELPVRDTVDNVFLGVWLRRFDRY